MYVALNDLTQPGNFSEKIPDVARWIIGIDIFVLSCSPSTGGKMETPIFRGGLGVVDIG
jgi:hypothetical protein